nr:Uncharacterised protein [Raoultella sp. NCTC 9187]
MIGVDDIARPMGAADAANKAAVARLDGAGKFGDRRHVATLTHSHHHVIFQHVVEVAGDEGGNLATLLLFIVMVEGDQRAGDGETIFELLLELGAEDWVVADVDLDDPFFFCPFSRRPTLIREKPNLLAISSCVISSQ